MAFVRQFLIYGLAGAASRLAALVLVPLYTHALSVQEYGILELLLAIHALVVLMGGLQVESAVARDYQQALEGDAPHAYRWTALWLTLFGTSAVGLLLVLTWWAGAMPVGLQGRSIAWLVALTAPVQLFSVQMIMLRFSGRVIAYALLSFTDLSLSALFSWIFIVLLDQGLDGALTGLLSGKLVCMAIAWTMTFGRPRRPGWRKVFARQMLAYGVPSLPTLFVNWLQNNGSRVLLAVVLSVQDVALAGLAVKVSSLYGFVVYSFRLAWEPYAMGRLNGPDGAVGGFGRTLEWYVGSMFLCCGLAVALGPAMVGLLSPAAYTEAGLLAGMFIVGQFWVGVANIMVIGIHGARKTGHLLPVYTLGMLVNVVLLLGMAPRLGVASAGVGYLGGTVASALLAGFYSNKLFNTGFSWRLLATTLVGSVVMLVLLQVALAHRTGPTGSLMQALLDLAIGFAVSLPIASAVLWLGCGPARARNLLDSALDWTRAGGGRA